MRSIRFVVLLSAALACAGSGAFAQTAFYGMGTGAITGVANTGNVYGATAGAYFDKGTFINYGLDFRGTFLSDGSLTQFDSGMGGLRLSVKPHIISLNPYGEVLGGVVRANYGQGSAKTTKTNFGYELAVGADFTVLPHIDWRVLEFSYTRVASGGISPKALSTGIVIRLF